MYIFSTNSIEAGCPVCGFKISDLYSTQKFGCNFCYLFLDRESEIILKNLQDGSTKHVGKRPKNKKKLLKEFFDYIIKKEIESEDSNSDDCRKLQKLLTDYF
jgi:protein-arginine kinase activator protein McsA